MTRINAIAYLVPAVAVLAGAAGSAFAQQQDQQVTAEAIARTCREIHKAPNAEPEMPSATQYGIVIHCRVVNAAGATRVQVSPEEVCQRMTGSGQWYRGAGTQVICRAGAPPSDRAKGEPRPITPEDIARTCQDKHRNPQATAETPVFGPHGVELRCRLVNAAGVTIAQVSPEDVCERITGHREWYRAPSQIICRSPVAVGPRPAPAPAPPPGPRPDIGPAPGPGPGPGSGPGPGGKKSTAKDTPVDAETLGAGCGEVRFGKQGNMNAPTSGPWFGPVSVSVVCGGGTITPEAACQRIAGVTNWYLGPKKTLYCRTAAARTEEAAADVWRACRLKGARGGFYGADKTFTCGYAPDQFAIAPAEICRLVHGTSGTRMVDGLLWCTP